MNVGKAIFIALFLFSLVGCNINQKKEEATEKKMRKVLREIGEEITAGKNVDFESYGYYMDAWGKPIKFSVTNIYGREHIDLDVVNVQLTARSPKTHNVHTIQISGSHLNADLCLDLLAASNTSEYEKRLLLRALENRATEVLTVLPKVENDED